MAEALHCPAELVGQGYGLINDCLRDGGDARRCVLNFVAYGLRGTNEPFSYVEPHTAVVCSFVI